MFLTPLLQTQQRLGVELVSHGGDGHEAPPEGLYEGPHVAGVVDHVPPARHRAARRGRPVGAVQTCAVTVRWQMCAHAQCYFYPRAPPSQRSRPGWSR